LSEKQFCALACPAAVSTSAPTAVGPITRHFLDILMELALLSPVTAHEDEPDEQAQEGSQSRLL
jgi:hypothetical protein